MSGTGWFFTIGIIYLVLLFTLAVLSFRKGHWVLGLIGFIFGAVGDRRHPAGQAPPPLTRCRGSRQDFILNGWGRAH